MAYDNTNRGAIWKNADKETDKHPDFKGSVNVEGREYWVSAWKRKEGDNPKAPALSFKLKLKEQRNEFPPDRPANQVTEKPFDDDLPF